MYFQSAFWHDFSWIEQINNENTSVNMLNACIFRDCSLLMRGEGMGDKMGESEIFQKEVGGGLHSIQT